MTSNGLTLKQIKSEQPQIESFSALQELKDQLPQENCQAVTWLDHAVHVGTWENGRFHFYQFELTELKHVQKLRIFNQDMEWLVWRIAQGWKARLRKDTAGTHVDVVDARQILVGTAHHHLGAYTEISEERGYKLVLPLANLKVNTQEQRAWVHTRNYIDTNDLGQVGYVDCRFIEIGGENGHG